MFDTIRKKLVAGFSAILVIIIASTIYNLYIYNNSKEHIMRISKNDVESYKYARDMIDNVIQISQYLTDVSASKDETHFKDAEEQYLLYKKNTESLVTLSPEYRIQSEELSNELEKLYLYGKEMAEMYIKNGHENGNAMMAEFDKMADSMIIKVVELRKQSEASMNDSLMTIQMHMGMNQSISLALAVITVILALFIAVMLAGSITKPINKLLDIFRDLEKGQGDLTRRITIKSKDEIARMAQSFNNFMDSMENMVVNIKKNSAIVSEGSELLTKESMKNTDGIVMINAHMGIVTEDTQKITSSINQITGTLSEIAHVSQASASDSQQISLETVNISKLAQESGKIALDTKLEMEKTERISSNTIEIAKELGSAAGEIEKIIKTIKSITDQTNLLALNATIEAARAGEQGKGFGVVADEIRKLAESNNHSAKNIENIVKNIEVMINRTIEATTEVGRDIAKGSKMAEDVHGQVQNIVWGINNINGRIQSIAACTEEQGASIEELSATMEIINQSNNAISKSMQEVSKNISVQTVTVKDLSSTASDLNVSAGQLIGLVDKFKLNG